MVAWDKICYATIDAKTADKELSSVVSTPGIVSPCLDLLWAKSEPYHALWKHLLDTSAVCLALPALPGTFGLTEREAALLVGLHDVGKADPSFQHKVPSLSAQLSEGGFPVTADAPCRHERVSAGFVAKMLKGKVERSLVEAICLAIAAHHGDWETGFREVGSRYREAQEELYGLLCGVLEVHGLSSATPTDLSAFGMLLAGRIVLCDWVASNEGFFTDPRLLTTLDALEYFARARRVADEWVARLGLCRSGLPGQPRRVVESPRPLQATLIDEDIPPGLVIVEAPMGDGKTEAAWILGEKWRDMGFHGMYMALPTMATSESLYARYRDALLGRLGDSGDVKLVHGMAWIRDMDEQEVEPNTGDTAEERSTAAAWFRPTRRAMLAAHGVGTVDQAMLAGMNVRFGFLRLYGLAGRVLVIDEVHAYDAYMSTIITQLLSWCACLSIPVVLLSATLSAAQRRNMIEAYGGKIDDEGMDTPYPLVTVVRPAASAAVIPTRASSNRTLRIERLEGMLGDAKQVAARAVDLVHDGGCCCVVVNTVRQAQAVYGVLDLSADERLLFHARFTASDRQRIAERVITLFGKDTSQRPRRFVVVATQVVEQSLDVDFDHMISEVAPVDLLLQRSGRLHRHYSRGQDPVLNVLLPGTESMEFGGTGRVYAGKPLLRTLAILGGFEGSPIFKLPRDFRSLIERCYASLEWEQNAVPWEAIREADREWEVANQLLESQARQFTLREPRSRCFRPVGGDPAGDDSDDGNGWRAKTRLGAADRTAVLIPAGGVSELRPGQVPMARVRALYRRSVKLPGYLPVSNPASGFEEAVEGRGRLRGLLLLPTDLQGVWECTDEKGGRIQVGYSSEFGLQVERTP